MKILNIHEEKKNGVAFSANLSSTLLVPLLCALTINVGAAQAQQKGSVPVSEQYAGKQGRFGYMNNDHVNIDSYVSDNIYGVENLAYYGDWDSNRIFIFDVDNMILLTIVENTGAGPYGIDQQSPEKAYALTRQTESLTIVNNQTFENDGLIPLAHKPRSTHYNPETDLTLVSGGGQGDDKYYQGWKG